MDLFSAPQLFPALPSPVPAPGLEAALLLPALAGRRDLVGARLAALEAPLPLADRGPLYAVAARALLLVDRPDCARRALRAALDLEEPAAAGLAPWLGLAGSLAPAGQGATWADAACDLAAWSHLRGGPQQAGTWAEAAERACPGHAEARRWLDLGPAPAPADLRPDPVAAWLSPCRLRRRVLGGLWTRPAPPGSAERERQDRGILTRLLGPTAPVFDEAAVDLLASRLRAGRPVGRAAEQAWRAARRLGPGPTLALARWLVAHGSRDPDLRRVRAAARAVLGAADLGKGSSARGTPQLALPAGPAAWGGAPGPGSRPGAGLSAAPCRTTRARPPASARSPGPA